MNKILKYKLTQEKPTHAFRGLFPVLIPLNMSMIGLEERHSEAGGAINCLLSLSMSL